MATRVTDGSRRPRFARLAASIMHVAIGVSRLQSTSIYTETIDLIKFKQEP